MSSALDSDPSAPHSQPTRTCVGCRVRAVKSELLRVTARDGLCLPDPRSRQPGRGAYLHPTIGWTISKDPFSGNDYVYRRQGRGFIVYSLGENMKDDGGRPEYDAQGNWRGNQSDIVWQCSK